MARSGIYIYRVMYIGGTSGGRRLEFARASRQKAQLKHMQVNVVKYCYRSVLDINSINL